MEQRGQPPLDRDKPVRVSADRDAVRRAAELAARMKGRMMGLRLMVRALLSAKAEAERVEARARKCDTGVA